MAKIKELAMSLGPYFAMLLLLPFVLIALACGYIVLACVYVANPPVSLEHTGRWHPLRALNLLSALLQQLVIAVRLAYPCLKSTFDRGRAPSKQLLRDVPYRSEHSSCTMDLHLPPDTALETTSTGEPILKGKRVLVFVNGFAFRQGNNEMYFGIGQRLAEEFGAVVAIPNVRGYPVAEEVNVFVDDVGAALGTLASMGAGQMELIAHSSGASLLVIGMLRAARQDADKSGKAKEPPVGWQHLDGFRRIKQAVLLAGVFDIGLHYRHEWRRGLEGVSCLGCVHQVAKGGHPQKELCSVQVAEDTPAEALPNVPPLLLLHGDCDDVVPETHSERLFRALRGAESTRVLYHLLPRVDHYDIAFSIANRGRGAILEEISSFFARKQ